MIAWLDPFLLPLLLASPLLATLFVWVMPQTDRLTLRHMGLFTSLFCIAVELRLGSLLLNEQSPSLISSAKVAFFSWPLQLELQTLPWLLSSSIVFAIAIRSGASRINPRMKSYVALMLLTQTCVHGALLAKSPIAAWALMSLSTFPIAFILGVFGRAHKGESALFFIAIHGVFDAFSLVALIWMQAKIGELPLENFFLSLDVNVASWVFVGLSLGSLSRLLVVPFSSWSRGVSDNAPISVVILVFCIGPILGSAFWLRFSLYLSHAIFDFFPILLGILLLSAFIGAASCLVDKDMRRFSLGTMRFFSALSFIGFLTLNGEVIWLSQAVLCISSVALCSFVVVLDSIDRRYVSTDSVELVGFRTQLPGLWRLLFASMLSSLALPFFGAGLFMFRLFPLLGMGTLSQAANLPKNTMLFISPLFLVPWLLLLVASGRHLRRTGSFPLGTSLAIPSELTGGQAIRLWIPLMATLSLSFLLLDGEYQFLPHWQNEISFLKKNVISTSATQVWTEKADVQSSQGENL